MVQLFVVPSFLLIYLGLDAHLFDFIDLLPRFSWSIYFTLHLKCRLFDFDWEARPDLCIVEQLNGHLHRLNIRVADASVAFRHPIGICIHFYLRLSRVWIQHDRPTFVKEQFELLGLDVPRQPTYVDEGVHARFEPLRLLFLLSSLTLLFFQFLLLYLFFSERLLASTSFLYSFLLFSSVGCKFRLASSANFCLDLLNLLFSWLLSLCHPSVLFGLKHSVGLLVCAIVKHSINSFCMLLLLGICSRSSCFRIAFIARRALTIAFTSLIFIFVRLGLLCE